MFSRVAGYAHNNLLKLSIQSPFRDCLLQRLFLCKGIWHAWQPLRQACLQERLGGHDSCLLNLEPAALSAKKTRIEPRSIAFLDTNKAWNIPQTPDAELTI